MIVNGVPQKTTKCIGISNERQGMNNCCFNVLLSGVQNGVLGRRYHTEILQNYFHIFVYTMVQKKVNISKTRSDSVSANSDSESTIIFA